MPVVMRKILFVEDDALITLIYSQKLTEQGFDVATAGDGLEAIRQLPVFKPDLVVLDLLMPRMSGADVLKFMRQHPDLKSVRVIVFSNSFLSDLVSQVASMGVEAALVKAAVTPMRLIEVINETLGNPGPHQSAAGTANFPVPAPAPAPAKIDPTPPAEPPAPVSAPPPPVPKGLESVLRQPDDSEFDARMRQQFLDHAPGVFQELRQLCGEFLEAAKSPREAGCLTALNRKLGFLTQISGMAGCPQEAELSSALEALLFELANKPATITDSSRQTIAATIAFLADRFERGEFLTEPDCPPANILVIDDDAVSNLAIVQSLGRAKLHTVSVTDPTKALEWLKETPYDAVLMDVSMPKINGLVLCEQMRTLPLHKRTPVIFVTGLTDFQTQARSILSGGNDLIAKPISPNELCVKVITHLLKSR
jgi:CheY-like chemotaxis protein